MHQVFHSNDTDGVDGCKLVAFHCSNWTMNPRGPRTVSVGRPGIKGIQRRGVWSSGCISQPSRVSTASPSPKQRCYPASLPSLSLSCPFLRPPLHSKSAVEAASPLHLVVLVPSSAATPSRRSVTRQYLFQRCSKTHV